jgi:hypothetical protein
MMSGLLWLRCLLLGDGGWNGEGESEYIVGVKVLHVVVVED